MPKPKKVKPPDPALAVPCPYCRVGPGEKCKNYLGKNKANCPGRGNAGHKMHARRAEKENAKAAEQMPLFAPTMEKHTAEGEYWRWRRNVAMSAETLWGTACWEALQLLEERALARLARQLLGEVLAGQLDAYLHRVYPCADYWIPCWKELLTGRKRVVLECHLEYDPKEVTAHNSDGRHVVEDTVFPPEGWTPPISVPEMERLFPSNSALAKPEQPDDGGLMAKLQAVLENQ